jgi:diketogulonate reductase-like aldo/keto reductase
MPQPGQDHLISLAWQHARKPWIVPILGTTNLKHLEENLGAYRVRLTAADMEEIERGFTAIGVHGLRFSQQALDLSDIGAVLGISSAGGHGKSPLPNKR